MTTQLHWPNIGSDYSQLITITKELLEKFAKNFRNAYSDTYVSILQRQYDRQFEIVPEASRMKAFFVVFSVPSG